MSVFNLYFSNKNVLKCKHVVKDMQRTYHRHLAYLILIVRQFLNIYDTVNIFTYYRNIIYYYSFGIQDGL